MADKRRGGTPPATPPAPGAPSAEDLKLWRRITGDMVPLKRKRAAPEPPPASEPPPAAPAAPAGKPAPPQAPRPKAAPAKPKPKPLPRSLGHGDIADVDKRSAERMRRGRLPVEAALDLHGYSQRSARDALDRFLEDAQAAGLRCVLVVTGKGTTTAGGGVLRAQVPAWLNELPNRPRVLAFDYAQPQHGGMGALYILLRKRRARGT